MYLNLIQVAESFGVTEKVVDGWLRNRRLSASHATGIVAFCLIVFKCQNGPRIPRSPLREPVFLAPEKSILSTNLPRPNSLLHAGGIWRDVPAAEAPNLFERIVSALPGATPPVRQLLSQRLRAPGGVTMAPIGGGFALPHPSTRITLGRNSGTVALLFMRDAMALSKEMADGVPITRLFFFIAPSPRAHLDLLGRLSRNLGAGLLRELLLEELGEGRKEIFQAITTRLMQRQRTHRNRW